MQILENQLLPFFSYQQKKSPCNLLLGHSFKQRYFYLWHGSVLACTKLQCEAVAGCICSSSPRGRTTCSWWARTIHSLGTYFSMQVEDSRAMGHDPGGQEYAVGWCINLGLGAIRSMVWPDQLWSTNEEKKKTENLVERMGKNVQEESIDWLWEGQAISGPKAVEKWGKRAGLLGRAAKFVPWAQMVTGLRIKAR